MARKPRLYTNSQTYHVILRGNNQQNLFLSNSDRNFFLNRLSKYAKELNIEIYAYCLMNNHVHILLGKATQTLSLFVQKLANSYVYYFNRKYDRTGHLFQGRFKSEPINDDLYFKTVLRYIIHNPEKANIAKYNDYKWNSFHELNKSNSNSIINTEHVIKIFDTYTNLLDYLSLIMNDKCMEYKNKLFLSDKKALNIIASVLKIKNPRKLNRQKLNNQIDAAKQLKMKGLSINQISRLTGMNKKIIKIA